MRTVYKYPINHVDNGGVFSLTTYRGAKLLHFDVQGITPTIWLEVDTDKPRDEVHRLQAIGTGHTVPPNAKHVASYLDGPYVWHIYDLAEPEEDKAG